MKKTFFVDIYELSVPFFIGVYELNVRENVHIKQITYFMLYLMICFKKFTPLISKGGTFYDFYEILSSIVPIFFI